MFLFIYFVLPKLSRIHADTNCPHADCVSSWTMVLIGMGVSYMLGQGSLFSSLSPFPPPAPPLYPPTHPSILFQPFGQLSLNPANHRLGWSVGSQTSPRLRSCPAHNDSGLFHLMFTTCSHVSKPGFWVNPKCAGHSVCTRFFSGSTLEFSYTTDIRF